MSARVILAWSCQEQYINIIEEYYVVIENVDNMSLVYYRVRKTAISTGQSRLMQELEVYLVVHDKYRIIVIPVVRDIYHQTQLGLPAEMLLTVELFAQTTSTTSSIINTTKRDMNAIANYTSARGLSSNVITLRYPNTGRPSTVFFFIVGGVVAASVAITTAISCILMRRFCKRHGEIATVLNNAESGIQMVTLGNIGQSSTYSGKFIKQLCSVLALYYSN
ncbi:uncharacterized protein [Ptychodera flava]|uniref:uncharacterized protein n=1 Tax=Ptychodera flava TaxID=63121 RepID=UPI00396A0B30